MRPWCIKSEILQWLLKMLHLGCEDGGNKYLTDTERGICRHSHTETVHPLKFLWESKQKFFKFFSVGSCSVAVLDVGKEVWYWPVTQHLYGLKDLSWEKLWLASYGCPVYQNFLCTWLPGLRSYGLIFFSFYCYLLPRFLY